MKHDLYGPNCNDQRGRIIGTCYRCGRGGVAAGDECEPVSTEEQSRAFNESLSWWLDHPELKYRGLRKAAGK